jgi:manganese transport protein
MSSPKAPPLTWPEVLRQLGPGLIIAAVIVGSGELIVTPKLGAQVGFNLLWFIILGCLLKVFIQVELGRFAISRGLTTIEAMNTIPGPRWRVSWLVWLWLFMYVALVFQVAGMVGGIAEVMELAGLKVPPISLSGHAISSKVVLGFFVVLSCAVLLITGRYRLIERASTAMVALFTLCTIVAVGALQWSPYAIHPAQILQGLSFHLPAKFTVAFAAFGIIGVGASELIYYPYWCLEKGYAAHVGPRELSPAWFERARGWIRVMRVDAWVSLLIYTGATVAFYLLGAAVLYGKGLEVDNTNMIETLSHMYRESFGAWSMAIFLVGAGVVLYSTVFGATASNARLFADALSVFQLVRYDSTEQRMRIIKMACVALPFASLLAYALTEKPVNLIFVGAIAQGIMLPFLSLAAVYFRFFRTDRELQPGRLWTTFVILAAVAMVALGTYQVADEIKKHLNDSPRPAPVRVPQKIEQP